MSEVVPGAVEPVAENVAEAVAEANEAALEPSEAALEPSEPTLETTSKPTLETTSEPCEPSVTSVTSVSSEPSEPCEPTSEKPPHKSVGFAADVVEIKPAVEKVDPAALEANPFFRTPPEFAHLNNKNRAPNPAPLLPPLPARPARASTSIEDLGDLRLLTIKDFSVQNKGTQMNFHYPTINRPIGLNRVLVDVKYASLAQYDLHKIAKYPLNLSTQRVGLGYDFAGVVASVGPNVKDYKEDDVVVGMLDPNSRKGALATSINVRLGRDVLFKVADLHEWTNVDVVLSGQKKDDAFALEDDQDVLITVGPGKEGVKAADGAQKAVLSEAGVELSKNGGLEHADHTHTAGIEAADKKSNDTPIDNGNGASSGGHQESDASSGGHQENDASSHGHQESDESSHGPQERNPPATRTKRVAKAKWNYPLTDIPPLAKLSLFGSAFCRAKQTLEHLKPAERSNILINGGDTELGLTILQLLALSLYSHAAVAVVLVVRDRLLLQMTEFVDVITANRRHITVKLVTYDSPVKDLVLPGEKIPINYKARMVFSKQVIEAMLDCNQALEPELAKLDLLVDVVGCMQYFYYAVDLDLHHEQLDAVFRCKTLELLLNKIFKPKLAGSCLVSCCPFSTPDPCYEVELLGKKPQDIDDAVPWAASWWSNPVVNSLFGVALPYHYAEELDLKHKQEWILQALELARNGELKAWLARFCDWREDLRLHVGSLRKQDARILLKIEDF